MSGLGIFDPLLNRQRTDDTKTVHISGGGSNQAPVAGGSGGGGQGVPTGGTTGQMLAKINATDFNTEWVDPPTTPANYDGGNASSVYGGTINVDGGNA